MEVSRVESKLYKKLWMALAQRKKVITGGDSNRVQNYLRIVGNDI